MNYKAKIQFKAVFSFLAAFFLVLSLSGQAMVKGTGIRYYQGYTLATYPTATAPETTYGTEISFFIDLNIFCKWDRVTSVWVPVDNILVQSGSPAHTPGAGDPVSYLDKASGDFYKWGGASWSLIGSGAASVVVSRITNVQDTSALSPTTGDEFVNAAGDTSGVYSSDRWLLRSGGGGDNLGNHIAAQNIDLDSFWLSPDGTSRGLQLPSTGGYIYESLVNATYREQTLLSSVTLTKGIIDDSFLSTQISFIKDATNPRLDLSFNGVSNWRVFKDHMGIIPPVSDPVDVTFGDDYLYFYPLRTGAAGTGVLKYRDGTSGTEETLATLSNVSDSLALIDGSETKVNAGTNVTVTGTGTAGDPYIVNSSASGGGGGSSFGVSMAEAGSIANSLALITSSKTTLIVDSTFTLIANTTIPDSVNLFFVDDGRFILSTFDLTINSCIESPLTQIFDASSTGEVGGNGTQTTWFPEWFGAIRDDATVDDEAVLSTTTTILNNGGGVLHFSTGYYHQSESWHVWDNTVVEGEGQGNTFIKVMPDENLITYDLFCGSSGLLRFYNFQTGDYSENSDDLEFRDFTIFGADDIVGFGEFDTTANVRSVLPIGNNICTPSGAFSRDASHNILIENCTFNNITALQIGGRYFGFYIPDSLGAEYSSNIIIRGVTVDTTSNKALEVQETKDFEISGCWIYNADDGIQAINYCHNGKIFNNHVEYWNAGISVSSGCHDVDVFDNRIVYDSLAGTRRNDQHFDTPGAFHFKHEDEQKYTTYNVRVHDNIFDGTESFYETGEYAVSVGFLPQDDSTYYRDIEIYDNKHIYSKTYIGGYDGVVWSWINNVKYLREDNFYPVLSTEFGANQRNIDSLGSIYIENCTWSDKMKGLITWGVDSVYINRNDMQKISFRFDPNDAGTTNGFSYNIVRDTGTIAAKAPTFNQFNLVTKQDLILGFDDSFVGWWSSKDVNVSSTGDIEIFTDLSGNGNHLLPATSPDSLLLSPSNIFNGYTPATDPVSGTAIYSTAATGLVDSFTIYALIKPKTTAAEILWDLADDTNTPWVYGYAAANTLGDTTMGFFIPSSPLKYLDTNGEYAYDDTQPHLYGWTLKDATTISMDYNSFVGGDITISSTTLDATTPFSLFGRLQTASNNGGEFYFYEMIIMDRPATVSEKAALRRYFNAKYGTSF